VRRPTSSRSPSRVRANVEQSVGQLRRGSKILERLIDIGQLHVIGAEYSLETGRVAFFDDLPSPETASRHFPQTENQRRDS
jgi:carbonic anhydrase